MKVREVVQLLTRNGWVEILKKAGLK